MLRTPPRSLTPSTSFTNNNNNNHSNCEEEAIHLLLSQDSNITSEEQTPPQHTPEYNQITEFLKFVIDTTKDIRDKLSEGKSLTKSNKLTCLELCCMLSAKADTLLPAQQPCYQNKESAQSTTNPLDSEHIQETIKQTLNNNLKELKGNQRKLETKIEAISDLLEEVIKSGDHTPSPTACPENGNGNKILRVSRTTTHWTPPTAAIHQPDTSRFRHALTVCEKNNPTSSANTLQAWRDSVSFVDTNFSPANIKYVSNNKIRVEFDKPEHIEITLNKIISPQCKITAEPAKTLQPMVILKGVPKSVTQEELVDIITKQNDCISKNLSNESDLIYKFSLGNRNANLYNAVIQASQPVWRTIIANQSVNLNHNRIHVENYIPILQCFKCLQFGHTKKRCTNQTTICSHCSSTSHTYKDCAFKSNPQETRCHNCSEFNHKHNITNKNIAHSATSAYCPRHIQTKRKVQTKINYGQ